MADGRAYARAGLGVVLLTLSGAAGYTALVRARTGSAPTALLAYLPPSAALSYTWRNHMVHPTILHESSGHYDAININGDGNGVSIGLISWAQRPGGLIEILDAWYKANPAKFAAIFGPRAGTLLAQARSKSSAVRMAPVGGVVLWQEPWLSRLRQALSDPEFKAVQDDTVLNGSYMRGALNAASILGGTPTERGLSILFDTAVQQGTGAVATLARQAVAAVPGGDFDARARQVAALAPVRVASSPALAADVQRRMTDILGSSLVTDTAVA